MSQNPAELQIVTSVIERFEEFTADQTIQQVSLDLNQIKTLITSNIVKETSNENRERLFTFYLQIQSIDRLFSDLNDLLT